MTTPSAPAPGFDARDTFGDAALEYAALRDTARAQILARVGEPDLADHRVIP